MPCASKTWRPARQAALRAEPGLNISTVALDLPCSFFMMRTALSLPIVAPVARRFVWSRHMGALAQKVIDGMAAVTGEGHGAPEDIGIMRILNPEVQNQNPKVLKGWMRFS